MGWQLEVGKMFGYVMVPIIGFHIFNQPQIYEKYVVEYQKSALPPNAAESIAIFEKYKRELEEKEIREMSKV